MIERLLRHLENGSVPDARAVVREANRLYFSRRSRTEYNDAGVDVFAEDWDTLVILDACRFDAFAARSTLPGRLESRESRGSMTPEWLRANFAGRDLTDTVYVTANSQFAANDEFNATLHAVVSIWGNDSETGERTVGTVPSPEVVTEEALAAAEDYPRKRLVVHYIPPHQPYLGPTGRPIDPELSPVELPGEIRRNPAVTRDVIRAAYVENLDIVLEEVRELIETVPGKTVVSADHGELLGESLPPIGLSQYGHPNGIYHETLVRVPWHVHTNGDRPEIVAEVPDPERGRTRTNDDRDIEQNLADLGYVT
jgi:hypothetical protein